MQATGIPRRTSVQCQAVQSRHRCHGMASSVRPCPGQNANLTNSDSRAFVRQRIAAAGAKDSATHSSWRPCACSRKQRAVSCAAQPVPTSRLVLERQPGLSDLVTVGTGPLETIMWKVLLDMLLPLTCLLALQRAVDWAAERAGAAIKQRRQGEGDITLELSKQSTILALVLLAMKAPATFVLPFLCVAYTVRTALNIVDLVVHKYRPELPAVMEYLVNSVSQQLIPLDNIFSTLFSITGILFTTWFLIQLKDIFIREIILVEAIRSGRKELERVYLPLNTLVTWAAVLACGVSILTTLGISLQPLLAVGGAGGIAAGFASQQVLTNIVSGINIFLTRPFVVGDQVQFVGIGPEVIEGVVEGVEIMRTLVRTSEGTLVAVPNKVVADLAVLNRTRTLKSVSAEDAAVAAAAAPLRRVLCFHIQLDRFSEPLLEDVITDVREYLTETGMKKLKASGVVSDSDTEEDETADGDISLSEQAVDEGDSTADVDLIQAGRLPGYDQAAASSSIEDVVAAAGATAAATVKQAVDSAVAAVTGSDAAESQQPAGKHESKCSRSSSRSASQSTDSEDEDEDVHQVLVSIALSKLTVEHIKLFVRCEMVLPAATVTDVVEQQTKATLLGVSSLVREKFGGVLLW